MSVLFVNEAAKAKVASWYESFRDGLRGDVESRQLDTPQGTTHVLSTGPKHAPPLVCLHGALASSAHVLPELGSLVERYRVHAVDVIGQSVMSADARLSLNDDSYGHWVAAVYRGLGLERAALLGVSWGGYAALRAAVVAPQLISSLILVVPAGIVSGPAWDGFAKLALPILQYRLSPTEKRLSRVCDALFTSPDERWQGYFADALKSYRMDARIPPLMRPEQLQGYRGKSLIFGAEHDISFPGRPLLERARVLLPRAELELLNDCKHCPPFQDEFRVRLAARVDTFLKSAA